MPARAALSTAAEERLAFRREQGQLAHDVDAGGTDVPQSIGQARFDAIVNSPMEAGS